jgi:hypothetical protein
MTFEDPFPHRRRSSTRLGTFIDGSRPSWPGLARKWQRLGDGAGGCWGRRAGRLRELWLRERSTAQGESSKKTRPSLQLRLWDRSSRRLVTAEALVDDGGGSARMFGYRKLIIFWFFEDGGLTKLAIP